MNPIWGNDDPVGLVTNGLMTAACVLLAFRGYWRLFLPFLFLGILAWISLKAIGLPMLVLPLGAIWMPFGFALCVRDFFKQENSTSTVKHSGVEPPRRIEERSVTAHFFSVEPNRERQKSPLFWDE